ncbi:hypothetical protein DS884_03480 [Tenacibaculum sp. E3R01]|uniref:glycosyltransferase family 4 protein n=1 Tax=Tenacibaculum sp. E3R01 TaxID=2267227 RepID=UPI000DE83E06|nr:glycosyltransferase family 4 protein [Tenacibaculum sp. E3R01]RBW61383.1 hypothetical protein DS884_03480 [Tenacibaculum sp. E3R01]
MTKSKLHILFLCGWYPSRVLPNNGDFIQRHAEAVSLKHQVSVLHIISDASLNKNIEIFSESINEIHTQIAYIKPSKNPIIKIIRYYNAFIILLKRIGTFDIVHLNKLFPFGILALYLKWVKKKQFVISEHWTGYHMPLAKKISNIELFLSKIIAKQASYICPVSDDLKHSMLNLNLIGKYLKVPNVVNTNLFFPLKIATKQFTIVHISNMLDSHKNVSGIIKTITELNKTVTDFKLILIGENSLKYKDLADKLKISHKIDFIDHIPHFKVINYIQQADVFVLFSNYENLPCVILESFACATPVISTNVGGISEYFPNKFGFLIEPKNEDQLLEKLIYIYRFPKNNTEKMYKYAQENFSNNSIANQFSKLYEKALN